MGREASGMRGFDWAGSRANVARGSCSPTLRQKEVEGWGTRHESR